MRQIAALHLVAAVSAMAACTRVLEGQSRQPILPVGVYEYAVRGFFGTDEMEPWQSRLSVHDTVMAKEATRRIVYESRMDFDAFLFTYSAEWSPAGQFVSASWKNGGRQPGSCTLAAERGRIVGQLGDGTRIEAALPTYPVVPDFALGAWLASRPLSVGDSVHVAVIRCFAQNSTNAIETLVTIGIVRDSVESLAEGGTTTPVWIVQGAPSYPFLAAVSKDKGILIRTVTPQGSVGFSVDRFTGKR